MFALLPWVSSVHPGHALDQNPAVSCINEGVLDLDLSRLQTKDGSLLQDLAFKVAERTLDRTAGVELGRGHALE